MNATENKPNFRFVGEADSNLERTCMGDTSLRFDEVGALHSKVTRLFQERVRLAQKHFRERTQKQTRDSQPVEIGTYTVELVFNQLPDLSDRRCFNSVPARLQLPSSTVDRLKHLAAVELTNNREFRSLVADLRRATSAQAIGFQPRSDPGAKGGERLPR